MIRCLTRKDLVDAFEEAGKPLDKETKLDLIKVEQDLIQAKVSLAFVLGKCKCRICNYKSTIIVPEVADLDNMECANCGSMTMQEEDEQEWWQ